MKYIVTSMFVLVVLVGIAVLCVKVTCAASAAAKVTAWFVKNARAIFKADIKLAAATDKRAARRKAKKAGGV